MCNSTYVPGYEGRYIINTDGEIYSIPRPGTKGGYLKQSLGSNGYPKVQLTNFDGTQTTHMVSKLVMIAFVGPRPQGLEICHNNGDRTDSRLVNLRYDTHSANCIDKVNHGYYGERVSSAKLTATQVVEIRKKYATGDYSYSKLGVEYGVDKSTIGDVVLGNTWTHTDYEDEG